MSLRPSNHKRKLNSSANLSNSLAILLAVVALRANAPAYAGEASTRSHATPPCALVEDFYGDSQILDASRTQTQVVAPSSGSKPAVYCGGWISVENGWVQLTHRFGYSIYVGPHSFVQFLDDNEALVLFRGQIYAQVGGGMGELHILTPNARIKATRSGVIAIFSPEQENTQLITIDGAATIANRYEDSKNAQVVVKGGESSQLDLQLLRVAPAVPRIVATASLKAKLAELHVPLRQSDRALVLVRNRKHEALAMYEPKKKPAPSAEDEAKDSNVTPEENLHERYVEGSRAPARRSLASTNSSDGEPVPNRQDILLKAVGGSDEGLKILHPNKKKAKARPTVEVEDPEAKLNQQKQAADSSEKQRLIDELSKVRAD